MDILIVEDHRKINDLLARFASQDGHRPVQAYDAESALVELNRGHFDVILTDLMLPDMQGEEMIRRIRAVSDIYVMILSAKTEVSDRIEGLKIGADDYLTKPFSVEEVMAKLRNVEKRLASKEPVLRSYNGGELVVRPLARTIAFQGQPLDLTANEYDLFFHLLSHPQRVFTRDEILEAVFPDSDAYDRVIDAFVKNIRKKLGDDPDEPKYLRTVRGVGYQFAGRSDD